MGLGAGGVSPDMGKMELGLPWGTLSLGPSAPPRCPPVLSVVWDPSLLLRVAHAPRSSWVPAACPRKPCVPWADVCTP